MWPCLVHIPLLREDLALKWSYLKGLKVCLWPNQKTQCEQPGLAVQDRTPV